MTLEFIDSHTHLDASAFDEDREEMIDRARLRGVRRMITIGAGFGSASASNAIALAEKYPFIFATAGIHPHDAAEQVEPASIEELCRHDKVVAVGETGLDFFKNLAPIEMQYRWFNTQISIALAVKKPLVIHSRQAGEECFETLRSSGASAVGGVFHCFAEDALFAERLRDMNFSVSFPGTITFKKADALREVVKAVPIEQILIETDSPYMAPEPNRGKRCESSFVVDTAIMLAKIKGITIEEVAFHTTKNAVELFRLDQYEK